jgi:bifunctional DNA-binding transcriptional regulator/antitoxin component of YhaV-PrlF toxin-antitoxin module
MEREHVILRAGNRITVPKRVCELMGLRPGAVFELRAEGDRIVLQLIKKKEV